MFPLFKRLEVHDCGDRKVYACKLSDRDLFEREKYKTEFIQIKLDSDVYPEMSDAVAFCGSDTQKLPPIPALYMWIRGSNLGSLETWWEDDGEPLFCENIAYIGQTQNLQARMQGASNGEFEHSFLLKKFPVCVPSLFYDLAVFGDEFDMDWDWEVENPDIKFDFFALVFKPWWGSIESLKAFEKRMIRKYTPYGNTADNPWCGKKPRQLLQMFSQLRDSYDAASRYHQSSHILEGGIESFLWNKFIVDFKESVQFRRSLSLDSQWFDSSQLTQGELQSLERYLDLFEELSQLKKKGESNGSQLATTGQFNFGFSDQSR